MNKDELKKYQQWQKEVIDTAIRDFMYSIDVIEPLVAGHAFQDSYEQGKSPSEALKQYGK